MSTVSGQVLIHASPHEVFSVASDWQQWSEWFAGTSDFRAVTSQTRGNGSRYAYRARLLGIAVPVETEICDFVEGRGWRGVSRRGPRHETSWQFTPEGDGTRFVFSMEYQLPFIPGFIDRWLVRPAWQRLAQRSADNLKLRIERVAQPPAAASP